MLFFGTVVCFSRIAGSPRLHTKGVCSSFYSAQLLARHTASAHSSPAAVAAAVAAAVVAYVVAYVVVDVVADAVADVAVVALCSGVVLSGRAPRLSLSTRSWLTQCAAFAGVPRSLR